MNTVFANSFFFYPYIMFRMPLIVSRLYRTSKSGINFIPVPSAPFTLRLRT